MGVQGLWNLVEPSGKTIPLEKLENKVLAVDVSIWLHQLVKGNSQANAHLLGLFHRMCKLLFYKIRPVFVFDGDVPVLKKQTVAARQRQKGKLQDEAQQARHKLANNILKHTAIKNVLSSEVAGTQGHLSLTKLRSEVDIFELPPMKTSADEESDSSEIDDLTSSSNESTEKQCNLDLHSIDVNCEAFKLLPADMRHDILTDLKETRKQSSWAQLNEMPQVSQDFSVFQMNRLLKRRNFQVSLEETEKEIGGKTLSLGDLDALLKDQGVTTNLDMGKRIASDCSTRFIHLQEAKRALSMASTAHQHDQQSKTVQSGRGVLKVASTKRRDSSKSSSDDGEVSIVADGSQGKPNCGVKVQPKNVLNVAKDFIYVASGLPQSEIDKIIDKVNQTEKSKHTIGNKTTAPDNDIQYKSKLSDFLCDTDTPGTSSCKETDCVTLETSQYSSLNSMSHSCCAGPSHIDDEIDYIGIMSDSTDSIEELEAVQYKEPPIEIIIPCDKEYNAESDEFADIFQSIVKENKKEDQSFHTNFNSSVKSDKEVISINHPVDVMKQSNSDSVLSDEAFQQQVVSQQLPALEQKHSNINTINSKTSQNDLLDNTMKHEQRKTTISMKDVCWPKVQFTGDDQTIIQSGKVEYENTQHSFGLQTIDWKGVKIPQISQTESSPSNKLAQVEEYQLSNVHPPSMWDKELNVHLPSFHQQSTVDEETESIADLPSNIVDDNISDNLDRIQCEVQAEGTSSVLLSSETKTSSANISLENVKKNIGDDKEIISSLTKVEGELKEESSPETKKLEVSKYSSEHSPSTSRFTTHKLQGIKDVLERQHNSLLMEQGRKERLAASITDQMCAEAQELLQLFGVPYIVAPMEAEAQCAFLDYSSLTDGTISDDSDIWLFGGQTVYKNFFNQKKHVMMFSSDNIHQYLKLTRYQMILLALLTGSDYTRGLSGIGPVTAMEILAAFPTKTSNDENIAPESLAAGLREFREWLTEGRPAGPGKASLRNKLRDSKIHEGFPSLPVIEAYLKPTVDLSQETFSWAAPDVDRLREFAMKKFGWTQLKIDEILQPVINKVNERVSQKSLDSYFKINLKLPAVEGKLSKRVQLAVDRISNPAAMDDPAAKKIKRKSRAEPQDKKKQNTCRQSTRGRKLGRGKASTSFNDTNPQLPQLLLGVTDDIPQRERDKMNALKNKMRAIELFRTSKSGLDTTKRQKLMKRKELAKANLSESDSDSS